MADTRIVHAKKLNFGLTYLIDTYVHDWTRSSLTYIVHMAMDCIMSSFLVIAAIALTIQAWVNVDRQMVQLFLTPAMQSMNWFPTYAATIHIVGAAFFFFGFLFVFNVVVVLRFNGDEQPASWYYKIATLLMSMVGGLALFWHVFYTSYVVDPLSQESVFRDGINAIGFYQYVVVVADCLFLVSFAWDYHALQSVNKVKVC